MRPNTPEQFWKRVDKSGECWPWTGYKNQCGYGVTYKRNKHVLAHRLAWEIVHGAIPNGMQVLHKCDNPRCCNPAHLFLGTHKDNMEDMTRKGRRVRGEQLRLSIKNPPRGERCARTKLTSAQVLEIRRRYRPRVVSVSMLAKEFGINRSAIWKIVRGQRWRHLLQEVAR